MFTQYTRWTHWSPNTWATPATELQPLHNYLLRMRNLSDPSELSEKISFKEFCFGSDVIWRVGSGLIWRGVRSQVEKRVFDFLQTFLFCSDASVPVWSEQVCGNLYTSCDTVVLGGSAYLADPCNSPKKSKLEGCVLRARCFFMPSMDSM